MSRGSTLLEFGIAVPVLISVSIGIVDISRALQTYALVHDAAQHSARELATVNGQNSEVSNDERVRSYNWFHYYWSGSNQQLLKRQVGSAIPESETPPACASLPASEYCERQFSGFLGGGAAPRRNLNGTNAFRDVAVQALRAVLPVAGVDCSSAQCASATVAVESEPGIELGVSVQLRYHLPLLILGRNTTVIQASAHDRIESSYIDRNDRTHFSCVGGDC